MSAQVNLRPLGRSTLQVSPLTLGGNVFGWTADERTSFQLLDAWVDAGMNFIDTADVYSRWIPGHTGGESETTLGKWLKHSGKRSKVLIATKVGKDMGDGKIGLSRAYIRQAVEASLQRLQTDHIDLYQSHDDDANTPLEETLQTYGELIQEGKVRCIGASNYSAARLALALDLSTTHRLPRYESLQPLYNLYDRAAYEDELQALCVEQQVGVINFYGLASGFLTGKYRSEADKSKSLRGGSVVKKYLNERGLRILAALDQVAQQTGHTVAQVALAWQMAQPGITAPIASATSITQLDEMLGATSLQLSLEALNALSAASA